jgi:toxin secretion/phage lysis holin
MDYQLNYRPMPELTSYSKLWMAFGAFMLSYFSPIKEIVHVMIIFLAVDTISGVWAAYKSGEAIESHKLRKTVYKLIWYTAAVMLTHMAETCFSLQWSSMTKIVAAFICFVELKSIFENIARITDEPVFKRLSRMFKKKTDELENHLK